MEYRARYYRITQSLTYIAGDIDHFSGEKRMRKR